MNENQDTFRFTFGNLPSSRDLMNHTVEKHRKNGSHVIVTTEVTGHCDVLHTVHVTPAPRPNREARGCNLPHKSGNAFDDFMVEWAAKIQNVSLIF